MLQYSYHIFRYHDPNAPFIEMSTPNVEAVIWYLMGGTFQKLMFSFSLDEIVYKRIPLFLNFFINEYSFLLPITLIGIFYFQNRTYKYFLALAFIGNLFFAINYRIFDIFVYLIPNYFILAIFLGRGLQTINDLILKNSHILKAIFLIMLPFIMFTANYSDVDQHENTQTSNQIKEILYSVNNDGIIISPHYSTSMYLWYYLIGENYQENNIYVMHYEIFTVEKVRSYIVDGKSFYIPNQRIYVPTGLQFYCIDSNYCDKLEKAGFTLVEVRDGLYKVVTVRTR